VEVVQNGAGLSPSTAIRPDSPDAPQSEMHPGLAVSRSCAMVFALVDIHVSVHGPHSDISLPSSGI
jgi:hypothetical protein